MNTLLRAAYSITQALPRPPVSKMYLCPVLLPGKDRARTFVQHHTRSWTQAERAHHLRRAARLERRCGEGEVDVIGLALVRGQAQLARHHAASRHRQRLPQQAPQLEPDHTTAAA